jgi:hypothetical protein
LFDPTGGKWPARSEADSPETSWPLWIRKADFIAILPAAR